MASKELQELITLLRSLPDRSGLPFPRRREEFEKVASQLPVPEGVRSEPLRVQGIPAEWILPDTAGEGALLYLHGGGYTIGSIKTHRALAARVALAAAVPALMIDYRLAPEHPYPAAVEDAVAAYRWLLGRGFSPARIGIAGDSAGGGLTVAALVALREKDMQMPAAAVCLSPWVDMEMIGESMRTRADIDPVVQPLSLQEMAEAYLGDADPRTPLAAPLYADLTGLPPMLIQVGTAEVLLDDATRLAERARAAGVDVTLEPWDDMVHVWHFFAAMLPEAGQAIDRIGSFIQRHLG